MSDCEYFVYYMENCKVTCGIKEHKWNFNGSNTFGILKISSREGLFEPKRVDNSARSGGLIRISLIFYNMKGYYVFSLESHR